MIDGVIIKELKKYEDDRGWLTEIYRVDEDNFQSVMGYASHTKYGIVRGPHEHKHQADFFIFQGPGDFDLHLWDNRAESKTFGNYSRLSVGFSNPVSVYVPKGVVHGYKSISLEGSFSINLPDKLYKGENKLEEIDEIRHEIDSDSQYKIR
jgi:dTDP-4-dehydrorhamnose 3,5-epimerase